MQNLSLKWHSKFFETFLKLMQMNYELWSENEAKRDANISFDSSQLEFKELINTQRAKLIGIWSCNL